MSDMTETPSIDKAIEKANRLAELLREASAIVSSLCSNAGQSMTAEITNGYSGNLTGKDHGVLQIYGCVSHKNLCAR